MENVLEYVLHLDPIEHGHRSVRPHPIHHGPQFEQERYKHESLEQEHVQVTVAFAEEVAEYSGRVATSYLIGGQQQIETLDHVVHLGRQHRIEIRSGHHGEQYEQPDVEEQNLDILEYEFGNYVLAQEYAPVYNNEHELQDQHHKEQGWNSIVFQI